MANLIITDSSSQVAIFTSAARTTTVNSDTLTGVDRFSSLTVEVDVTAASGTTPTLDIYVQKRLPDSTNFTDVAAFTQISGVTRRAVDIVTGGNEEYATGSGALAAGTIRNVLMGREIRIRAVIGGTNPSFTFSVDGDFFI